MMLYDQLSNIGRLSGRHKGLYKILRNSHVYDLSNIVPLFEDWEKQRQTPIPKRPPGDLVWCEWDQQDPDGPLIWRIGCSIQRVSLDEVRANGAKTGMPCKPEWEEACICMPFYRLDGKADDKPKRTGNVKASVGGILFCFSAGATIVEPHLYYSEDREPPFGLPFPDRQDGTDGPMFYMATWPAFMAFSLLHCKNVAVEDIKPARQTRHACNKGMPPKRTYHVLRLSVPQDAGIHGNGGSLPTGRHMRFHLCRGHFKNLQHERFREKGWHWWPAHWRGAKSLGTVEKRYELHGGSQGV